MMRNNMGFNPQMMMQNFGKFMNNPVGMIAESKFNIPSQIANDPNEIIQYLMNNGKIDQNTYNTARRLAQQFGYK